jgi:hypothetical protein
VDGDARKLTLAAAFGWTPRTIADLTMSEIVWWSDGALRLKRGGEPDREA